MRSQYSPSSRLHIRENVEPGGSSPDWQDFDAEMPDVVNTHNVGVFRGRLEEVKAPNVRLVHTLHDII